MDQTFISIHDLGEGADILFISDSVTDILGYHPQQVVGRSCFDFFHPEEVQMARKVYARDIRLDKAAALNYLRIQGVDGQWINCECCFTIVHDVMVACTSIYQQSERSERRALEAPHIRRLFACSAMDPRYYMLEHLSYKFEMPATVREPRVALIVNRFTRSLRIMFSTDAVASILGIPAPDLQNQSFYDCIDEACVEEAFQCLERAKANDSIAYLRFWSRDPRPAEDVDSETDGDTEDESMVQRSESDSQDSPGGVRLTSDSEDNSQAVAGGRLSTGPPSTLYSSARESRQRSLSRSPMDQGDQDGEVQIKRSESEPPLQRLSDIPLLPSEPDQSYDAPVASQESQSTVRPRRGQRPYRSVELEAVVSCTSDGLVVILRRARPAPEDRRSPYRQTLSRGQFAAPWAHQPAQASYAPEPFHETRAGSHAARTYGYRAVRPPSPVPENTLQTIRESAVFAWAVVGINENLADYAHGDPRGEAVPSSWQDGQRELSAEVIRRRALRRRAMGRERRNNRNRQTCNRCNGSAAPSTCPHCGATTTTARPSVACDCIDCRVRRSRPQRASQQSSGTSSSSNMSGESSRRHGLRTRTSMGSLSTPSNGGWWTSNTTLDSMGDYTHRNSTAGWPERDL